MKPQKVVKKRQIGREIAKAERQIKCGEVVRWDEVKRTICFRVALKTVNRRHRKAFKTLAA